ncbi:MAG TPA: hypothetical protein VNO51_21605 [Ilumatobacteraceae bacterium]|nr:hypothetical protein [Ilumatobacteraceae bacterium]
MRDATRSSLAWSCGIGLAMITVAGYVLTLVWATRVVLDAIDESLLVALVGALVVVLGLALIAFVAAASSMRPSRRHHLVPIAVVAVVAGTANGLFLFVVALADVIPN